MTCWRHRLTGALKVHIPGVRTTGMLFPRKLDSRPPCLPEIAPKFTASVHKCPEELGKRIRASALPISYCSRITTWPFRPLSQTKSWLLWRRRGWYRPKWLLACRSKVDLTSRSHRPGRMPTRDDNERFPLYPHQHVHMLRRSAMCVGGKCVMSSSITCTHCTCPPAATWQDQTPARHRAVHRRQTGVQTGGQLLRRRRPSRQDRRA